MACCTSCFNKPRHWLSMARISFRTVPSTSSNSNNPAATGHPPGRPARCAQPNQLWTNAFNRGSPSSAFIAGWTTCAVANCAVYCSNPICTSALERKWAKSPLLDMPTCSASTPSVTPAKPDWLISASPCARRWERPAPAAGRVLKRRLSP